MDALRFRPDGCSYTSPRVIDTSGNLVVKIIVENDPYSLRVCEVSTHVVGPSLNAWQSNDSHSFILTNLLSETHCVCLALYKEQVRLHCVPEVEQLRVYAFRPAEASVSRRDTEPPLCAVIPIGETHGTFGVYVHTEVKHRLGANTFLLEPCENLGRNARLILYEHLPPSEVRAANGTPSARSDRGHRPPPGSW